MSDRRHDPTAQRLRDARRDGDVPLSRELAAGLSLLAALVLAVMLTMPLIDAVAQLARQQWSGVRIDGLAVPRRQLADVAWAALPLLGALLAAAWLSNGIQTRFLWAPARLRPDWRRLHWGAAAQRVAQDAPSAALGWVKSGLALAAAGWILWGELPRLARLPQDNTGVLTIAAGAVLLRAATKLALVLTALGALDYLWQHWRHRRRLRMTDDELRQSQRDHESPAQVASERRRRHQQLTRR